ncbi:hypothetical protein [Romboutsia lituseburensis]|uniref:hypothetical protein n=1 Tax=Romboutsia lituseburensis TaxID=1537 RepID=UPI00215B5AD3|nr:hypothetical protein [Romboutsia lituseburensis]MCR8746166.1 hypothetical protein [Romboutsia lituseburensis]
MKKACIMIPIISILTLSGCSKLDDSHMTEVKSAEDSAKSEEATDSSTSDLDIGKEVRNKLDQLNLELESDNLENNSAGSSKSNINIPDLSDTSYKLNKVNDKLNSVENNKNQLTSKINDVNHQISNAQSSIDDVKSKADKSSKELNNTLNKSNQKLNDLLDKSNKIKDIISNKLNSISN